MTFKQFVSNFHREESGQDTVEYVMIGAAVILALVGATPSLTTMLSGAITSLGTKITNALA